MKQSTLSIDYGTKGDHEYFKSPQWTHLAWTARERDGHVCQACESTDNLTVHHVHPRSEGGRNVLRNLTTLCTKCHDRIEMGEDIYKVKTKPVADKDDWHSWVYGGYRDPNY